MREVASNLGGTFAFVCAQGAPHAKILGCDLFREGFRIETNITLFNRLEQSVYESRRRRP